MSPTSINKKLIIYMFYSKITNPTTQHPTGTILNCFMITCSHSQHSVNVQKTRWLFINIQQRTQTLTKCLRRLTSRRMTSFTSVNTTRRTNRRLNGSVQVINTNYQTVRGFSSNLTNDKVSVGTEENCGLCQILLCSFAETSSLTSEVAHEYSASKGDVNAVK